MPLIPRPSSCAKRSIHHLMGLSTGNHRFIHMRVQLQNLIDETFDVTIPYETQDPDIVEQYRLMALDMSPLLRKYKEGWPALVYLQRRLQNIRKHSDICYHQRALQEQRKTSENLLLAPDDSPSPPILDLASDNELQDTWEHPEDSEFSLGCEMEHAIIVHPALRVRPNTTQDANARHQTPQNRTDSMDGRYASEDFEAFPRTRHSGKQPYARYDSQHSTPPTAAIETTLTSSSLSPEHESRPDPLTALLGSLALNIPRLRARFLEAGIDNLDHFQVILTRWTEEERSVFFRDDMNLSLSECCELNTALMDMLSEADQCR
ncbi:hypothetical protein OBBRIDRAFT_892073 [Obba rivulosa]|uniref:Uncharacterized protein n=1 Tax=Obba rivulosa TaxID=1052685 RepID=A0A8E2DEQ5_9APHY|nr:hypothetical protein OBBRIDRAFT_892073 [Obba rivulosa]